MLNTLSWIFSREGVFPRTRQFSSIEAKCPLFSVMPDKSTTLTRGGVMARLIELRGKDYTGLDPSLVNGLFNGRKGFFESLPSTVMVFHQSHRIKVQREQSKKQTFALPIAAKIAEQWEKNFTVTYRTKHFLIFATSVDSLTDQLQIMAQKSERSASDELYRILCETSDAALLRLKEYSPQLLEGDKVASYWGWLINGKPLFQKLPDNGLLDGILAETELEFPDTKPYQIYRGQSDRYSAWLTIKKPDDGSDNGLLDGLFKGKHELSLYQTFSCVDKQTALSDIEDRKKNVLSFLKSGEVILMELQELAQRIQANELSMLRHRWAIEIFGDSPEALEQTVREVRNTVELHGYRVAREKANREAQFWARFPEYHIFNARKRSLTSENAAHFATFSSVGEGLDRCSWGNAPITEFKTLSGGVFSFTFHSSPAPKAPGHTLLLGGNNLGKTTLVSHLLSQCFKYPRFRALLLDRLHGLKVFTHTHDGIYLDTVDGVAINPLQLPDNAETKAFLASWLQVLTGKEDDESNQAIDHAIEQLFTLDADKRTLPNLADAFGLKVSGSIRAALERWLTGPFSQFFTGDKDVLDFSQPLVTLDMTTLLDLPEVLSPLAYYLFHKLLVTAREQGGYAVFVDELPKYLASPIMAPKIEMMLQEIRKTDGVFIGAAQSADSILNSVSASKFLSNIETYIYFPDPRATRAHYMDALGLNEAEFHWLTAASKPREVLIKRKNGESTIINVDLAPLGKYLKAFDSSSDAVAKARMLREQHGKYWKTAYFGS